MSNSKKNRVRKMFNPATYEGFMPNEQVLAEAGLEDEAVKSIQERMNLLRPEAVTKYETWVYSL